MLLWLGLYVLSILIPVILNMISWLICDDGLYVDEEVIICMTIPGVNLIMAAIIIRVMIKNTRASFREKKKKEEGYFDNGHFRIMIDGKLVTVSEKELFEE